MSLHPLPGFALIELSAGKYQHVAAATKVYESKTSGKVISISSTTTEYAGIVGRPVFWDEFKTMAPITRDDKEFTFVKLEDLQGYDA